MTNENYEWQPARFVTVEEFLQAHPHVTAAELQPWRRAVAGKVVRVRVIAPEECPDYAFRHLSAGGCNAKTFLQIHPDDARATMTGFPGHLHADSAAICEHDVLTD